MNLDLVQGHQIGLESPAPPLDPCQSCDMRFESNLMPLHEIQVHSPKSACPKCKHNLPTQLMDLHLVIFHPEEQKVKEEGDFTLEEKVEGVQEEGGKVEEGAGDLCQLCDQ